MTSLRSLVEAGRRVRDLDARGADLSGADLSRLSADRVDFRSAILSGATLRQARAGDSHFDAAVLDGADCSKATLRMCTFDRARAIGARFDHARVEDSSAHGIDLSQASLRGTHLSETSFARAVMREAALDNARGDGIEFRGADLSGATLTGARFDDADFRGADLRGADLSRGRFRGADFRGALLEGARFERADCAGAQFDRGVGPHPDGRQIDHDGERGSFDRVAVNALQDVIRSLPAALAAGQGPAAELIDHVKHMSAAAADLTARRPEEWRPWVEGVIELVRQKGTIDPEALADAFRNGPIPLPSDPAVVARLSDVVRSLATASDRPPEEWQALVERLMKVTNSGEPLDAQALLAELALLMDRSQRGTRA